MFKDNSGIYILQFCMDIGQLKQVMAEYAADDGAGADKDNMADDEADMDNLADNEEELEDMAESEDAYE